MPPTIDRADALYRENEKRIEGARNDFLRGAPETDADRLPLNIAVPVVIALNLSLWVGIGYIVRAFL
jgi:hypothetical protein